MKRATFSEEQIIGILRVMTALFLTPEEVYERYRGMIIQGTCAIGGMMKIGRSFENRPSFLKVASAVFCILSRSWKFGIEQSHDLP